MKNNEVETRIRNLLDRIQNTKYFLEDSGNDLLSDLSNEIDAHEYRISVVGEFSSGKSTFLNALIGRNLLPHAKSETTATITYIHNVPKNSPLENKVKVVFYNDQVKELDISNSDVLSEYITAFSKQNVTKNIQCVNVFVNFAQTSENIVLVDTPGLNGVADGHRDLTMREIQRSNASICLFHLKGIGETDLSFIRELLKYQDKFFFVFNGIDDLKASEGESYETRLEAFRQDVANNIPNRKGIEACVYGISALNALASRDLNVKRLYEQDLHDLTPEEREDCFKRSKIDILEKDLYEYLSGDEKTTDFYLSIIVKLQGILESRIEAANNDLVISEAKIEDCPQKQAILKAKAELGPKIERMKTDLINQLGAKVGDLSRSLRQLLTQEIEQKRTMLSSEIQNLSDLNIARKYMEDRCIVKSIESFAGQISGQMQNKVSVDSSNIYRGLLLTMQRIFPKFSISEKKISVNSGESFQDVIGSVQSSDRIDQLRSRIERLKVEIASKEKEQESARRLKKELDDARKHLRSAEGELQRDIARLGARPSGYYRTETCYRKRSGISGLFKSFFGSDYEEYEVEVFDDSAGEDWDERKNSVIRDGQKKIQTYQRLYDHWQRASSDVDPVMMAQQKARLMEKLKQSEQDIIDEQRKIKEEEQLAKTSALKRRKDSMLKDVNRYLTPSTGELFLSFVDGINKICNEQQKAMEAAVIELWNQKKKVFLGKLDLMITKFDNSNPEEKQSVITLKNEIQRLRSFSDEAKSIISLLNNN